MPFSEDDLRNALRRKDPGAEFTRRVMERIRQGDTAGQPQAPNRKRRFSWIQALSLRPLTAIAVLLLILLAGSWIGYQNYRGHQWEAQVRRQRQERAGQRATQETILALRITSEKLNHVFQKVNSALPADEKIRRERL
jgi:hypothetical protein